MKKVKLSQLMGVVGSNSLGYTDYTTNEIKKSNTNKASESAEPGNATNIEKEESGQLQHYG